MKGARGINGVGTFVDVANDAVLVDHKGDAVGKEAGEAEDTVSLGHLLIGVTQQWETRGGFLGKSAVPLLAVETDPQHLRACRFKLGDITLIRLDLFRSTGGGSANIKGENHRLLAMEVGELYQLAVLIGKAKSGARSPTFRVADVPNKGMRIMLRNTEIASFLATTTKEIRLSLATRD